MNETTSCRWDREAEDYLRPDGTPCKTDDYGDPTRHCTHRRSCAQHIGRGDLTCARCLGRTRRDIRALPWLTSLMLPEAIERGVNSEAASLAGPAADVEAWSWRKISARQGRAWHISLLEDDDELHPYSVLGRWAMMLAEDYGHDLPILDVSRSAAYLERHLHVVAQDPEQDFALLAREVRRCRTHLESVLRDSRAPQRGAPCPACIIERPNEPAPRLAMEHGHWCTDADCERLHYADDSGDRWTCPRDSRHEWTEVEYRLRVADVYADHIADTG